MGMNRFARQCAPRTDGRDDEPRAREKILQTHFARMRDEER